ncbi:MAG: aspartate aminotransferase [Hydrogenophilales bacterium CG03_land_8_20_14_0_80_62_28]|nr:pyridoxal phosphate-dependent aminotransferase [Betaproteobacteria bacterium]OIO78338.1 MAG: aspartate aminotransferase [Hydrogenophilaceae bacterium CG1_02_62_390]PIV23824.1 MAG: aspartate aminotransferase [Hydrogenophilales bacterium CG03_land_8_20_14_0_80_62_28]PIW38111.1 MAG: aspartate aminotransferase [Hydrogenophilales bacterium CG15_BIG_FIL_POST_REV_8_21_14_020_62_31]PIW72320.1 MAG: aspartate aminotransferase [Hydrogenophilales bacterium CG12_big_fil_rev_8_21_14_0_65_61_21]PIX01920.1
MELSQRVRNIKPSPTLAISARATQLKAEGKDIVNLGAGEPDFDTPQHIKAAAIAAIDRGFTKYTAVGGMPSLKKAVADKFKRENGLDYAANQILVSCGGKQSFYNLCQAYIGPGDEVIIPAPYWVSYPDIVVLADGKPVIVEATIKQGFKITPAQLAAAITPRTKMLVLNSPSNPTGAVYTLAELAALGEVLRQHPGVLIASDDMYEHILLSDQPFANILNACPDLYDRTMVLNGVSKAYAMTGWRIGYAAGPKAIIGAMDNIQSQSTSNPTSISQVAAEAALNGDQACIEPMLAAFKERHRFVVDGLNAIPGLKCVDSGGAFYAFPDAGAAIAKLYAAGKIKKNNDLALTAYLLEHGVAVVPGSAFGAEGCIRLSFATSKENLAKALDRIAKALT